MVDVVKGKKYKISFEYLVDGVDAVIPNSQVWASDSSVVTLESQTDGSVIASAVEVGSANIHLDAKGNNGAGEVPLFGNVTLSVSEVVVQPVEVTLKVEEVV